MARPPPPRKVAPTQSVSVASAAPAAAARPSEEAATETGGTEFLFHFGSLDVFS